MLYTPKAGLMLSRLLYSVISSEAKSPRYPNIVGIEHGDPLQGALL